MKLRLGPFQRIALKMAAKVYSGIPRDPHSVAGGISLISTSYKFRRVEVGVWASRYLQSFRCFYYCASTPEEASTGAAKNGLCIREAEFNFPVWSIGITKNQLPRGAFGIRRGWLNLK